LASRSSAAADIRRAAETRRIIPLLSRPVLSEYRMVLTDLAVVAKFPEITPELVGLTIRRLLFVGDYHRAPVARFIFPRDPHDEKFIELAIASTATHLVTSDNDLLSLPMGRSDAARRFRQRLPTIQVLTPEVFVAMHGASWQTDPT